MTQTLAAAGRRTPEVPAPRGEGFGRVLGKLDDCREPPGDAVTRSAASRMLALGRSHQVSPAGARAIAALSVALRRIDGVSRLRVIAAAIVSSGRLLLVSKRAAPDLFYLPGGKPMAGESAEQCLHRELSEELLIGVSELRLLTEVHAKAALEPVDLHMTVYAGRLEGEPRAAAEIASLLWWPDSAPVRLAPAVHHHVVPLLRAEGRLRTMPSPQHPRACRRA